MGWAVGWDYRLRRDVGYGVPAVCDDPSCSAEIDRGLSYCCGQEPFGGEKGCGLHFCGSHLWSARGTLVCRRCKSYRKPYTPKPDTAEWNTHKLTDPSWAEWRAENPEWVAMQGPLLNHTPRPEGLIMTTATDASTDVLAERRRQIVIGFTPEHDDTHTAEEIAQAAACYALPPGRRYYVDGDPPVPRSMWPWEATEFQPAGLRRNLVIAGALILAAIEHLDRASLAKGEG